MQPGDVDADRFGVRAASGDRRSGDVERAHAPAAFGGATVWALALSLRPTTSLVADSDGRELVCTVLTRRSRAARVARLPRAGVGQGVKTLASVLLGNSQV